MSNNSSSKSNNSNSSSSICNCSSNLFAAGAVLTVCATFLCRNKHDKSENDIVAAPCDISRFFSHFVDKAQCVWLASKNRRQGTFDIRERRTLRE